MAPPSPGTPTVLVALAIAALSPAHAQAPPEPPPAPAPPAEPAPPPPAPAPPPEPPTATFDVRPEGVQVEVDGTPVEGTVQLEPGPHEVVVSLGIKARVFSVTVVEGKPNTWCYDFDAAQRISEGPCDG